MRLTVKLYATLADYLPAGSRHNRVAVDVGEAASVSEVLAPYAIPAKQTHLVLLNGVFIPAEKRASTRLKEDDTLAVWPPIAGG